MGSVHERHLPQDIFLFILRHFCCNHQSDLDVAADIGRYRRSVACFVPQLDTNTPWRYDHPLAKGPFHLAALSTPSYTCLALIVAQPAPLTVPTRINVGSLLEVCIHCAVVFFLRIFHSLCIIIARKLVQHASRHQCAAFRLVVALPPVFLQTTTGKLQQRF